LQGRSLTGPKAPDKKADPIIVHPDIRRMLMTMKAFNEAGRPWRCGPRSSPTSPTAPATTRRQGADDYMGLMTPVVKGVLTDKGFDHAVMASRCSAARLHRRFPGMSQFVRDARIAMIYEGANGIQALDLVGRKLGLNGGRAIMSLLQGGRRLLRGEPRRREDGPSPRPEEGLRRSAGGTMWLVQNGMAKPGQCRRRLDRLHASLRPCGARLHVGADGQGGAGKTGRQRSQSDNLLRQQAVTGRFFMERIMPETSAHLARISTGADTLMALPAEAF
jgi:acyl-CoA dehydrogenase